MFSKTLSRSAVSVLGFVLVMSLCIGLSGTYCRSGKCHPGFPAYPMFVEIMTIIHHRFSVGGLQV